MVFSKYERFYPPQEFNRKPISERKPSRPQENIRRVDEIIRDSHPKMIEALMSAKFGPDGELDYDSGLAITTYGKFLFELLIKKVKQQTGEVKTSYSATELQAQFDKIYQSQENKNLSPLEKAQQKWQKQFSNLKKRFG